MTEGTPSPEGARITEVGQLFTDVLQKYYLGRTFYPTDKFGVHIHTLPFVPFSLSDNERIAAMTDFNINGIIGSDGTREGYVEFMNIRFSRPFHTDDTNKSRRWFATLELNRYGPWRIREKLGLTRRPLITE